VVGSVGWFVASYMYGMLRHDHVLGLEVERSAGEKG
jgi:hypothetical protein